MKKGQALVEFVIILPIFILLVFGVFDIGRIIISKINLESQMSDVIIYYKSGKTIDSIKSKMKIDDLKISSDNDYTDFTLIKTIDIITPGLQLIIDDPYNIEIHRSILNE